MQDIIKKIIEIDRMAQKMTDETNTLRDEAERAIEADKKKLRESYIERARHRISVIGETEEGFLKQALEDIQKHYDTVAEKLDAVYGEKKQGWVDEIYNRVIGG